MDFFSTLDFFKGIKDVSIAMPLRVLEKFAVTRMMCRDGCKEMFKELA